MKTVFLTIALIVTAISASASHIIGGSAGLFHVKNNDYVVSVKVLVDCANGNQAAFYEDVMYVNMFEKGTNNLVRTIPLEVQAGKDDTISISKKECADEVPFCMFVVHYFDTLTFSPIEYNHSEGYYISWERCCRNSNTLNIANPGETGITVYAEVPSFGLKNSSPSFKALPLNLLCVQDFFKYDFEIEDADGDSLSISLVEPLAGFTNRDRPNSKGSVGFPQQNPGPYPSVTWSTGYGLNNIMDGEPSLQIDEKTGVATVSPGRQGNFVFSVLVEEFRDGQKIGEVRRELQYLVSKCGSNENAVLQEEIKGKIFRIEAGKQWQLLLEAKDEEGDSVFYEAESKGFETEFVGDNTIQFTTESKAGVGSARFDWQPSCEQISTDTTFITITIKDNGCPLPATEQFQIGVVVYPPEILDAPKSFCVERLGNDSLELSWSPYQTGNNFKGYVILQSTDSGVSYAVLDTIENFKKYVYQTEAKGNDTSSYCYRIVGLNYCKFPGTFSYEFCSLRDVDVAPVAVALENINVNENEHIAIFWEQSAERDFLSYDLYRAVNEGPFDLLASEENSGANFYVDSFLNADSNRYSYFLVVNDQCSLQSSPSDTGSGIWLRGQVRPFTFAMKWNSFDLWESEGRSLKALNSQGAENTIDFAAERDSFTYQLKSGDDGQWLFQVTYRKEGGQVVSNSNTLELDQKPIVWIPTAFSPNDDNLNEFWDLRADFIREFELLVFNRWGQIVFESNDPEKIWDGENATEDAYLFKLNYRSVSGRIFSEYGRVLLLR